jgi:multiple sugar transport system ATP-binding protein
LGTKIIVLDDGIVQQIGAPEEIYDEPANRFVAGLFGSPPMNFLDVDLFREGERLVAHRAGLWVTVPPRIEAAIVNAGAPSAAVLGVRPESIRLHAAAAVGSSPAPVFLVEPAGHQLIVDVQIGAAMARVRADRAAEWMEELAPDSVVHITVDPHHVHLFDRDSGARFA